MTTTAEHTPEAWTDRVTGCLVGGALGDGVGRPFEGVAQVEDADVVRHLQRGGLAWTDDTAMMLTLAEHLTTLPGWEDVQADELALAHARAWAAEPWRGYGASPPAIFRAALDGQNWRAVAEGLFGGRGSLGNGAAMRAAPLGALPVHPEQVAALARQAAAVTHTHEEGRDGAVAVAVAAHSCLRVHEEEVETGTVWVADLLGGVAAQLRTERMRTAVRAVAGTLSTEDPVRAAAATGTGITATSAVPAALSAFLHFPTSPVHAIRFAVRMGGDTDTIATMAGALAGAVAGASEIPGELAGRLEQAERIQQVGAALAERTFSTADLR